MKRSWLRGHRIIWLNEKWVYADNGAKTPANGGYIRSCKKCRKRFPLREHDPCLGILAGVKNACCGHGVPDRAFISFKNGLIITGFKVEQNTNAEIKKCCICNKPITEEWAYRPKEPISRELTDVRSFTIIDEYVCSKCNEKKKPRLTYKMILEAMKTMFK